MSEETKILAAIKPMPYQGRKLLSEKWPNFLATLLQLLRERGFEHMDSSADLILFTFPNESSALSAIFSVIDQLKKQFKQKTETKLPLQYVLHLNESSGNLPNIFSSEADAWEMLQMETIYLTRAMKSAFEILFARQQLPQCTIKNEANGLFELQFTGDIQFAHERILAFRMLPIQGGGKPCFYCGMQSHTPAECPSKFLSMDNDGMAFAGYLPFKQLNSTYKKVFTATDKIISQLAAGVKASQIRKDPCLTVYVAFMDINRIYQPRFLWNISFSIYNKWETIFNTDKLALDNKNLQLGLDCLRVQQYDRAEELLLKECQPKSPKRLYATTGLAFLALERGRMADMRNFLTTAADFATRKKERLYIALLLARFYDLNNETWKARDLIKNAATIKNDCQELLYSKVQLEVRGSFEENAFQILRSLMMDQRHLYMTALMDPTLHPIQAKVEDILSALYQTLLHSAQINLAQASHEINELKLWFDNHDDHTQIKNNIQVLQNLSKSFARKSYFDVLDVAAKAKALYAASRTIRENKLNEIYGQANAALAKWNGYYHFWASYRFPNFFKKFPRLLLPINKKMLTVKNLTKKNSGRSYHLARQLLKEINISLKDIEPIYRRMTWADLFCSGALIFGRELFVVEIALALIAIAVTIILGNMPDNSTLSSLGTLTTSPEFQKRAGLFIALMAAPFIAIMLTLQKMIK